MRVRIVALVAFLAIAVSLLAASAASATGDYPHPSVTVGGECGAPSLTFVNPAPFPVLFKFVLDGKTDFRWVTPEEDAKTVELGPFDEESAHTLKYKIWPYGQEWVEVPVETDCLVDVTPEAPVLKPYECSDDANAALLVVPADTDAITYDHDSGPVKPGPHHVMAELTDDTVYEFADGAVTEWRFDVAPVNGCSGEDGTDGQDGADGAPGPVTVVRTPPAATPIVRAPSATG